MSEWHSGRDRNYALRSLSRFDVTLIFEDHRPVYRVKPKGYSTVPVEVRGMPGAHADDLLDIGNAIRTLARVGSR